MPNTVYKLWLGQFTLGKSCGFSKAGFYQERSVPRHATAHIHKRCKTFEEMLEHNKEIEKIIERNINESSSETEIEEFISDLKKAGSNPIMTMKIIVEKLNMDFGKAKDLVFNSSSWNFLYSQSNPFTQEFLDIAAEDADKVERKDGKVISVTYNLKKDSNENK